MLRLWLISCDAVRQTLQDRGKFVSMHKAQLKRGEECNVWEAYDSGAGADRGPT